MNENGDFRGREKRRLLPIVRRLLKNFVLRLVIYLMSGSQTEKLVSALRRAIKYSRSLFCYSVSSDDEERFENVSFFLNTK